MLRLGSAGGVHGAGFAVVAGGSGIGSTDSGVSRRDIEGGGRLVEKVRALSEAQGSLEEDWDDGVGRRMMQMIRHAAEEQSGFVSEPGVRG